MADRCNTRRSAPGPGIFGINNQHSGTLAMPDCTWYCYYRGYSAFHSFPVTSNGIDARNWKNYANWGKGQNDPEGGWKYINDRNLNNAKAGDILIFSANHVAFVEGDGTITESAWTTAYKDDNGNKVKLNRSKTALDLYYEVYNHRNNMAYNMAETSATRTLWTRFWYKGSTAVWNGGRSIWEPDSAYDGRLHHVEDGEPGEDYTPPDPGGGGEDPPVEHGWVKTSDHAPIYSTNGEYVCGSPDAGGKNSGSQDWPAVPEVYDQSVEDLDWENPDKHVRTNKDWDPLYIYTYYRDITYELKNGVLVPKAGAWIRDGNPFNASGKTYVDWDTSLNGNIPGWKIEW